MFALRGQKIQTSVERMFRIWKERRVYDNSYLKELEQLIEPSRKSQTSSSQPAASSFKVCSNTLIISQYLVTFSLNDLMSNLFTNVLT